MSTDRASNMKMLTPRQIRKMLRSVEIDADPSRLAIAAWWLKFYLPLRQMALVLHDGQFVGDFFQYERRGCMIRVPTVRHDPFSLPVNEVHEFNKNDGTVALDILRKQARFAQKWKSFFLSMETNSAR